MVKQYKKANSLGDLDNRKLKGGYRSQGFEVGEDDDGLKLKHCPFIV